MDAIAVSIAAPGQFTGIAPCGTSFKPDQAAALSRAAGLPAVGIRVCLESTNLCCRPMNEAACSDS